MSFEEVMGSDIGRFRGFGHPTESPHYEGSVDPTWQRTISELNAEKEAKRLRAEARLQTPEGRKEAAEAELAERKRKASNWGSRVIFDRGNGWKPIWGTAEDQELKIYTLVDGGAHRFWGIKPIGMGIHDFWDEYDPEVKRYDDIQQEIPVNPEAPTGPLIGEPPRSPLPPVKAAAKPKERQRKRQKTPEVNPVHRIRKSTRESPKVGRDTRKSLAHKVGTGDPRLQDQVREVSPAAHTQGRPARNRKSVAASGAQQKPATVDERSAPSKRPRGRPPVKRKPAEELPTKKKKTEKTPAVKGSARITKASQTERRPPAPSTHKMPTRRKDPAEHLQLP